MKLAWKTDDHQGHARGNGSKPRNAAFQVNVAVLESTILGSSPISIFYWRWDFSQLFDFSKSQFC